MEKEASEALQGQGAKKPSLVVLTSSQLETRLNTFLIDTFQNNWSYNQEQLNLAKQNLKPEMISPSSINWDQRRQGANPSLSGQYTLNPETQNLDFERAKVFIPNPKTLKQFEGKPLADLAQYLQTTYSNKYYIPGIEYWQYISQNLDKAPPALKDSKNYYFYFGSILRSRRGDWCVPRSRWGDVAFVRDAYWLGDVWGSVYRVVLLER